MNIYFIYFLAGILIGAIVVLIYFIIKTVIDDINSEYCDYSNCWSKEVKV